MERFQGENSHFYVVQVFAISQLRKYHQAELFGASEGLRLIVVLVAIDKSLK